MNDRRAGQRRYRLARFILCLLAAHFLQGAAAARAEPEDRAEEEEEAIENGSDEEGGTDETFMERLGLCFEADIEFTRESRGSHSSGEATFDEVGIALDRDWWAIETGIKLQTAGGGGLALEEASLRLGGNEKFPWFVQLGRIVVPFGEYESRFIEDPLTVIIGEIDDETLVLGFVNRHFAACAGALRGDFAGEGDVDIAASFVAKSIPRSRVGLSWTSDVGESVELREWRADLLEKGELTVAGKDRERRAGGFALYASHAAGPFLLLGEYVGALRSFDAGIFEDRTIQPEAWNAEIAVKRFRIWELAGRIEGARDLPETPHLQHGAALSCFISDQIEVTGELMRGSFDDGSPDVTLAGLKLALSY